MKSELLVEWLEEREGRTRLVENNDTNLEVRGPLTVHAVEARRGSHERAQRNEIFVVGGLRLDQHASIAKEIVMSSNHYDSLAAKHCRTGS